MSVISSGTVTVPNNVISSGLDVIQEGVLDILSGGTAIDIAASEGGAVVVFSEGVLTDCAVSAGGTATVLESGYAQDVTVEANGLFLVSSGGTAHRSLIQSGGTQLVYAETMAASATVMNGGLLQVNSDGYVRAPVVSQGGRLSVQQGVIEKAKLYGTAELVGAAQHTEILSGGRLAIQSDGWSLMASVSSGGTMALLDGAFGQMDTVCDGGTAIVGSGGLLYNATVKGGGALSMETGGQANSVKVEAGGSIDISSGGTAIGIVWTPCEGTVSYENGASVSFASQYSGVFYGSDNHLLARESTMENRLLGPSETMCVMSDGIAVGITVEFGGRLDVFNGGKLTGMQVFETGATVSMYESAILDFDISELTQGQGAAARINDLSLIWGMPLFTLRVSSSQSNGVYTLAGGATGFNSTITVQNTLGESFGSFAPGETLRVGDADYILDLNGADLTLTIKTPALPPENLVGTKDRVSWDSTGADGYVVEYSTDGFGHILSVATSTTAVDMLDLPAGTYQWRVKAEDGEDWAVGDKIVSDNDNAPKLLQSNADGNNDLFFAKASGTWENIFYAQHAGSVGDWSGTNEMISANGKNRLADLFFGSNDANILCLTDDENGDGIFVDDEYTELPESITEQQARIAQIDEIRAGAGDDIVDLTSNRIEYIGDGLTIRGGDGNDVIWANKGDNSLFGDAGNDRIVGASGDDVIVGGIGNDRMHGGGGNDIFTFCDNWGVDNVEQLATGSVTLWFAEGSKDNWDEATLTYTDGENSVKISGVAAEKVTLKFGDDGSTQFASLTSMGAFFDATSERIFEESGKGILASL